MNEQDYRNSIQQMINIELRAMTFYQHAACLLEDPEARFDFEMLADEELEHARIFYELYPDREIPPFETLVSQAQALRQPELERQMAGLNQQQALQVALDMELKVESDLRQLLEQFPGERARTVIRKNLDSTSCHAQLIAEDLRRFGVPASPEEIS